MILITGCTGYIGSRLTIQLLKNGYQVRGLAIETEKSKTKSLIEAGMELWVGDLLKQETLVGIGKDVEIVYHLAGLHSASIEKMESLYVGGTKALINSLDRKSLRIFISAGNGAVYGDYGAEMLTEKHKLLPQHPFGVISLKVEDYISELFTKKLFPGIIFRIAEVYGPQEYNPIKKVQPENLTLLGEGTNYTSRIHIDDLISILKIAPEKLQPGKVYNVSDDLPITQRAFYEEVIRITGGNQPRWITAETVPERIKLSIHGLRMLSIRMSNASIKAALNYNLFFPTIYEGLRDLETLGE